MRVLFEYESQEMNLTRAQALTLDRSGFVEVSPSQADRWKATASSYVGTLVTDGVKLLIRPKIDPDNLFLLLEPGLPAAAWRRESFDYHATSDLLPSIIAFFARTLETTLGRGVLRSYETREQTLSTLRGRLDTKKQLRQGGLLVPVPSSFDDFSEDVKENQILKAVIRLALRVPHLRHEERQRLMRQLATLEAVSDVVVSAETVDSVHFSRLNEHYRSVLRLGRLILANLTLRDMHGKNSASSFMVNMNDLFQRFVTERLRRALSGRLSVISEPTVHLGIGQQVTMQPDLEFRDSNHRRCFVGDIKYKLTGDARGRSSDYYQLHAYTTAMDLPEGMLIYCRRPQSPSQRTVVVKNNGKKLLLRSIDLTGRPEDVEQAIEELADAIAVASRHRNT